MHTFTNVLTYAVESWFLKWIDFQERFQKEDAGQSYLPLKKIETSVCVFCANFWTDMYNHGGSYQVLYRAMRGDRTEASLYVIRPVSTLTIPPYVCMRVHIHKSAWANACRDKKRQIDQRDALPGRRWIVPQTRAFPEAFVLRWSCARHAICMRTGPRRGSRATSTHRFPHTPIPSIVATWPRGFYLGRRENERMRRQMREEREREREGERERERERKRTKKNEALKRRPQRRPYYSVNITFVTWRRRSTAAR